MSIFTVLSTFEWLQEANPRKRQTVDDEISTMEYVL